MSDIIKDGGPAYPFSFTGTDGCGNEVKRESPGMSLRDWFAGMAIQGMYAGRAGILQTGEDFLKLDVEVAYDIADAMIAQRIKIN